MLIDCFQGTPKPLIQWFKLHRGFYISGPFLVLALSNQSNAENKLADRKQYCDNYNPYPEFWYTIEVIEAGEYEEGAGDSPPLKTISHHTAVSLYLFQEKYFS